MTVLEVTGRDPFDVLGLPAVLDLDPAVLERRYLERSRETHPDRHRDPSPELLADAAAVNDAYRALRDVWQRARLLCDRLDPAAFAAARALDPAFLAGAIELAEEVEDCAPDARAALRARIDGLLDQLRRRLADALAGGDARTAADLLHRSRYYRKALADLGQKERQ